MAQAVPAAHVHVVTADSATASFAAGLGARVVEDPGGGLNSAIRAGLEHVSTTSGDGPVGVLLGDLPTVTPAALSRALQACGRHQTAFVPDAEGTGTVLLTARALPDLVPAFGAGSAPRMPGTAPGWTSTWPCCARTWTTTSRWAARSRSGWGHAPLRSSPATAHD